jgi:Macrocin-O-methyltransferase (TylF)
MSNDPLVGAGSPSLVDSLAPAQDLCERIDRGRVAGAVVECGVLDGGTAALMAWATNGSTPARPVHLFDAWEGVPETTPEDGADAAAGSKKWATTSRPTSSASRARGDADRSSR